MPHYYFAVYNGGRPYPDERGELLSDDAAATVHAVQVVRELKQGTTAYDGWNMRVTQGDRQVVLISFDEVS
jgi:hypothetical protein